LAKRHPTGYLGLLLKRKLDWSIDLSTSLSNTDFAKWEELVKTAFEQNYQVWDAEILEYWVRNEVNTLVLFALENGATSYLSFIIYLTFKEKKLQLYETLIERGYQKNSSGEEIGYLIKTIKTVQKRETSLMILNSVCKMLDDGWKPYEMFMTHVMDRLGNILTPTHMQWLQSHSQLIKINKGMFLLAMSMKLNDDCIKWGISKNWKWHPETTLRLVQHTNNKDQKKILKSLELCIKYGCEWHIDTTVCIVNRELLIGVLSLGCPWSNNITLSGLVQRNPRFWIEEYNCPLDTSLILSG